MGNVYYKLLQEQQEQLVTQNKQAFADSRTELKQEWGADYNQIFAHMGTFLEQYPALKAVLNSGVGPNKIAHGYNADVLREIASLAKIVDPAPSIVGATMESKLETVEGELSKLTSMMGDHDSEYWKGPNAEKNQKRFRELTEIKQTFKK